MSEEIRATAQEEGKETETDSIHISPEVIGIIAGLSATTVPGIAGMSGGIVGGIAEMLGRKDLAKGIKVHLENDRIKLDLSIIVEYGVKIMEVAGKLKDAVRSAVENTTGMKVSSVNIHVQGINLAKEKEEEKKDAGEPREQEL